MKFFSVLLILFVSGCLTVTDLERLRQDVNGLQRESFKAKREIDSLKKKTAVTVKEISFSAVRESQAEMNSRLSAISMSLQELRGRFEENKYFFEKTLKDSAIERDFLRTQIASIENQLKILKDKFMPIESQGKTQEFSKEHPEVPKTDAVPADTSEHTKAEIEKQEQTITKAVSTAKIKAYEAAYQAFKDKNYKHARRKFEAFIKDYPSNELTDNAEFWIAETYYAEQDYEAAILAYETLLKEYPDSEKTEGALLKQGFAFIEIGDRRTGKIILEKLIERFPDSNGAKLAAKKLKTIDKKP